MVASVSKDNTTTAENYAAVHSIEYQSGSAKSFKFVLAASAKRNAPTPREHTAAHLNFF